MEASELSRKISELHEPCPQLPGPYVHYPSDTEYWIYRPRTKEWLQRFDWLGSDEANCRLLDEMKNPDLNVGIRLGYRTAYRVWEVAWLNISIENPDRRTAVALAYLKWKEG